MSLPVLPPVVEALPECGGEPRNYNDNYVFYWNNVALDLVRLSHTNGGHQNGPPLTARFLGILHLAMHDAYFDVFPYSGRPGAKSRFTDEFKPYLSASVLGAQRPGTLVGNAAEAKDAVAGAAITILNKLFKNPDKKDAGVSQKTAVALGDFVDASVRSYQQANRISLHSPAYVYGIAVARLILKQLETKAGEDGVDANNYVPDSNQPYWFDDDPSHPIRLRPIDPNDPEEGDKVTHPYHGPYYGRTAAVFATTCDIKIADPPLIPSKPPNLTDPPTKDYLRYLESVEDVHPQTARGLFWAYDGVNLIGTPPRLYNQIVNQIAFDEKEGADLNSDENNAQFIRLLALANVAMADAGIFCWRDKYKYELWRPLTGVRADPTGPVPDGHGRPTWRVLGAPSTNSNQGGFKPPFPAYPSGHATFAAAAFQMVRLFYDQRGDMRLGQDKKPKKDFVNGSQLVEEEPQRPMPDPKPKVNRDAANDCISFKFISDELNGISRTLYQAYNPSLPIQSQPGDIRTRLPITFSSLKAAIFSNGTSRIWLGVHWHFDGFAGETVCKEYTEGSANGQDKNLPQPCNYKQQFKVEADGSTMYQKVEEMDWFAEASQGPRDGCDKYPVGGVPLGMMIADNIFDNKMRSKDSLTNLGENITIKRP